MKTDYLEQAKIDIDAAEQANNNTEALVHLSLATTCALIAISEELARFRRDWNDTMAIVTYHMGER